MHPTTEAAKYASMLTSISADGCHGLNWLVRKGLVKTKFDGYMKYLVG